MAPFRVVLTSVLVFISVLECHRVSGQCHSTCSCLGFLVDCSDKGLVTVPSYLPRWTRNLDLSGNRFSSFDESLLVGLQDLTELDLSRNELRFVNGSYLPPLQKLALDHNRLSELPVLNQPLLTSLSAQHNEIHSLDSAVLEDMPRLETLDLNFNHLVDLPADTFGNSSSLLHLSLSHNRLVGVERGVFDNLTSLQSLRLSKNQLSTLPKELFRHLSTLQHLELGWNPLTVIEGLAFQGLSSLITLKLRHAGISRLQDGAFYGLSSIRKLQLDYNSIRRVTKGWMYGLNSLQRLYINNNNISEIEEDAWDSGKRIIELDLSHNGLQSITKSSFQKLYALKRLILSNNHISYIEEDSFHDLAALQHLELGENEVWWSLEDTGVRVFSGLRGLRHLGLGSNHIRLISGRALHGLSRLTHLNLTHNPLTHISQDFTSTLLSLTHLYLNTSDLLCDCNLSWMSRDFPFPVTAKCGYPDRLRGMSIFDLLSSKMICNESSIRPELLRAPTSRNTLKGENVTLECEAQTSHFDPVHVYWRKDGRLLQQHMWHESIVHRNGRTLTTSTLRIQSIQDEDEGHYQCVAASSFGSAYSPRARIEVNVFPVFTKTPVDVSVRSGNTVRLECGAKGQPQPRIIWRKDDAREDFPAARDRRMHVMPTDDVFFIVSAKPQDAGLYSCYANNSAGTISANATLTVLEFPSFVRRMEDKETRAGETTVLECLASGSPKPTLMWLRGGAPLAPDERHFFTAGDQLLIIVQTQPSDAGTYSCNITNSLGSSVGHSHLKVMQGSGIGLSIGEEAGTTTGVIVIAVVLCIVGTSIVWVVIIYHTRKRTQEDYADTYTPPCQRTNFLDPRSGSSTESGAVDSRQQNSSEHLLEDALLVGMPSHFPHAVISEGSSGSERSHSSVSRERVPLLHTFRAGHWNSSQPHQGRLRSHSAEQLGTDSCDAGDERDSGCSTLPRSLTRASVSPSPQLHRQLLPRDVPNDSGSFSITSEEPPPTDQCHSVTVIASVALPGCTCPEVPSA